MAKANAHLREVSGELFGVAKSQVTLLAGETGRDKRLRIAPLPPNDGRRSSRDWQNPLNKLNKL
jgi:uncharacterized protein YggU (UPF0235/DUF167 family)